MLETQRSVAKWARDTFPGGDDLDKCHVLRSFEEMVEMCVAAGCDYEGLECRMLTAWPWPEPEPDKFAAELADVIITLYVLADRRGIDIDDEVERKMKINRARRWACHGDGTGHHVKD